MCDNMVDRITELINKETPKLAKDAGSGGQERYSCPTCGEWWYGEINECPRCGQKMRYR